MFGWLSISALSRRAMRSTTSFRAGRCCRSRLILAAVAGVQRDGQHALLAASGGGGRRLGRRNRRGGLLAARQRRLGRRVVLAAWIALDVFQDAGQRIVDVGTALLVDHRDQRILRDLGIQVQHQAVLIVGNGCEREHLRRHRLLQVEHHPHHVGPVLRHAQALDIGSSGRTLDTRSLRAALMVRPSMSTTRRWGFSSVNCSALSSLSSSSVTRVYSSAGQVRTADGGGLGEAWQYGRTSSVAATLIRRRRAAPAGRALAAGDNRVQPCLSSGGVRGQAGVASFARVGEKSAGRAGQETLCPLRPFDQNDRIVTQ